MAVSRKDVEYIASLAKLRLDEDEVSSITDQLNRILEYVDHLNELETKDVEPLAHPLDLENVFREDVRKQSLTQEEALKNAPKRADAYFSVPKVVRK